MKNISDVTELNEVLLTPIHLLLVQMHGLRIESSDMVCVLKYVHICTPSIHELCMSIQLYKGTEPTLLEILLYTEAKFNLHK